MVLDVGVGGDDREGGKRKMREKNGIISRCKDPLKTRNDC